MYVLVFFLQKLEFEHVDIHQKFDESRERGSVESIDQVGDHGVMKDSTVVFSKSKKFIVSRVCDTHASETKISEDDGEDNALVSPDNFPQDAAQATLGAQDTIGASDSDGMAPVDNERSWKSTTVPANVPFDLNDLQEKLSKLTATQKLSGNQPAGVSQAVTPGEAGPHGAGFPFLDGQTIVGQDVLGKGVIPQQIQLAQKNSTNLLPGTPIYVQPSAGQENPSNQPSQPAQGIPVLPQFMPLGGQGQQMMYQQMIQQGMHYQNVFYPYYSTDPILQMQQQMMQYLLMQQLQKSQQHPSPAAPSQQQVNSMSQMYYPPGWVYPGQMPVFPSQQTNLPAAAPVPPAAEAPISVKVSPPHSPTQHRRLLEDGTIDPGYQSPTILSQEGQGRKGNDLADLEQELIKKLHGNRKDVATSVPPAATVISDPLLNTSVVTHVEGEIPLDHHPSAPAVLLDQNSDIDETTETNSVTVKKKSRFVVQSVPNDPLVNTPELSETKDKEITDNKDETSEPPEVVNHDTNGVESNGNEVELPKTSDEVKPAKLGRFRVTSVRENISPSTSSSGSVTGSVTESKLDDEHINTYSDSIPQITNTADEGDHTESMLKANGVSRFLQRLKECQLSYNSIGASSSHIYKALRAASLDDPLLANNSLSKNKRSLSLGHLPSLLNQCLAEINVKGFGGGSNALCNKCSIMHATSSNNLTTNSSISDSVDIATQTSPMVVGSQTPLNRKAPKNLKVRIQM